MTGAEMIVRERDRQTSSEGWTPAHDDTHTHGELAAAAIAYASPFESIKCDVWPWESDSYKPTTRIRDLVKAGALIAAEIDRLKRCAAVERGVEG